MQLKNRFRGFLPVIVDVETGGLNPDKDALLEVAAVPTFLNNDGQLMFDQVFSAHVEPFPGANLDPEALKFNKIVPDHPFRLAQTEKKALADIFEAIEMAVATAGCSRAVLVGHNAWFDLLFLKAAVARTKLKTPFHAFTCFDTATLAGFFLGQTVLAVAMQKADIPFNTNEAHSAVYDAKKTAELFCQLYNNYEFTDPDQH